MTVMSYPSASSVIRFFVSAAILIVIVECSPSAFLVGRPILAIWVRYHRLCVFWLEFW